MLESGSQNPFTMPIREALEAWTYQLMVCLPGTVQEFDPETQLAQVRPDIQKTVKGEPFTLPTIIDVPVVFPGDGTWYFFHQVTPGTEGVMHFSQRALDTWIDQGGPVAPNELRAFSEEDAFFQPGGRSRPSAIPDFPNDGAGISTYDGSTRMHLKSGGDVSMLVGNSLAMGTTTDEFLDLVSQTLQALIDSTTSTSLGEQPLSQVPTFQDLKNRLDAFKGTL